MSNLTAAATGFDYAGLFDAAKTEAMNGLSQSSPIAITIGAVILGITLGWGILKKFAK